MLNGIRFMMNESPKHLAKRSTATEYFFCLGTTWDNCSNECNGQCATAKAQGVTVNDGTCTVDSSGTCHNNGAEGCNMGFKCSCNVICE